MSFYKSEISLPTVLPLRIKPLRTREKVLPAIPHPGRLSVLKLENERLRRENEMLRSQLHIRMDQEKRREQIITTANVFANDIAVGVRHLQNATFKMKRAQRRIEKEGANIEIGLVGKITEDVVTSFI
jgi:hypothetical protein